MGSSGKSEERLEKGRVEAELIAQARAGSKDAQDRLLEHFDALVRVYLLRRMGSRLARALTVDDLVQEVFTRAVTAFSALREGATLDDVRGLLLQHARWVVTDRGRQARAFLGESVAEVPHVDAQSPPVVVPARREDRSMGPVTFQDMKAWIRMLVDRLPERYADVMRPYLAGKTLEEIAAELGIADATARKRFLRATNKLREMQPGMPEL